MDDLCLVFDLDDTLYPEHAYVRSGFAAVGRHAAAELGLEGLETRLLAHFEAGRRGDIFDRALADLMPGGAGSVDAALVRGLVEVYRGHAPELALHEDARAALARLGPRHPLGLISDGWLAVQQAKVAALGIAPLFRHIVLTDAFGRDYWKPHPRAYEAIEQAVPARRYAYVADNEGKDFVAPNARGWLTVRIARPGGEYAQAPAAAGGKAHATIASLDELDAIVCAACRQA